MATEKVSLSLEADLLEQARLSVGARRLSSYVNEALRRQLQRDRITRFLHDAEREHGPIDPLVMEEVRREWPAKPSKKRRTA